LTARTPKFHSGAQDGRLVKSLPFVVRLASSERDLFDVVSLRSRTYSRHKAPAAHLVQAPEDQDLRGDGLILVARSKVDGIAVGSVRVQTRIRRPLSVESAMRLPNDVVARNPIELMRGSIINGVAGRMVSASLAKTTFLLCQQFSFSHVIVTCREPVDLMYRAYRFDELLNGKLIDLPYSPGAQHKVLCLPIDEAAERWRLENRPLYDFMVDTKHPDIQLDYVQVQQQLARVAAGSTSDRALSI